MFVHIQTLHSNENCLLLQTVGTLTLDSSNRRQKQIVLLLPIITSQHSLQFHVCLITVILFICILLSPHSWFCLSQLHLLWKCGMVLFKQTRPVYLWEYSSKVAPAPLLHLNTVLIMSGHMIFKHQLSVNSEKLCKHFSASEWTEPQILSNCALSFCIAVYVPVHQSLLISVYLYIKDLIIVNIITVLSPSLSTLHLRLSFRVSFSQKFFSSLLSPSAA